MLFEKAKFGGDSMEYNQDAPGLQKWNDKAASAKILRECVTGSRLIALNSLVAL